MMTALPIFPHSSQLSLPQGPILTSAVHLFEQSLRIAGCALLITLPIIFVASPLPPTFYLYTTLRQLSIDFCLRCLRLIPHRSMQHLSLLLRSFFFVHYTAHRFQTLIHELGHKLTSDLCFEKARAYIVFDTSQTAYTYSTTSTLSKWGKLLGSASKVTLVVALAGPLLSLSVSLTVLSISLAALRQTPLNDAIGYSLVASVYDVVGHITYALSTHLLNKPYPPAHDFLILEQGGIPTLPIVGGILLTTWVIFQKQLNQRPKAEIQKPTSEFICV